MPALKAFKRRWPFGSDDLVFPGVISCITRILATIMMVALAWKFQLIYGERCQANALLFIYLAGILFLNLLSCCNDGAIAFVSSRGSITNTRKRSSIPTLLHIRLIVLVCELIWTMAGTFFVLQASNNMQKCAPNHVEKMFWISLGINLVAWGLVFIFTISSLVYFDPCRLYKTPFTPKDFGLSTRDADPVDSDRVPLLRPEVCQSSIHYTERKWQHLISIFCCCLGKSRDQEVHRAAYSALARVLANILSDLNHAVPSDVAAGLSLLQREQQELLDHGIDPGRLRRKMDTLQELNNFEDPEQFLNNILKDDLPPLDLSHRDDYYTMDNVIHYMDYACAAYGWLLYVYTNPLTWHMRLFKHKRSMQDGKSPTEIPILGDNSCLLNFTSLLTQANLRVEDILFVSFENAIYETPFFVAFDHSRASVVISCRGTLSLEDAITDISATQEALPLDGFSEEYYAHKGFVISARKIQTKLERDEILVKALTIHPDYKVVVVGHSLGAGCASVLAILLKQTHPNIKCYAYAPPGCLISKKTYEYSQGFVTSLVMGKDIVPRLSEQNGHELKANLIRLLELETQPKYYILLRNILENLGIWCRKVSHYRELRQRILRANESDTMLNSFWNSASGYSPVPPSRITKQLVLPGRIIYVIPSEQSPLLFWKKKDYTLKWAEPSDFQVLLVGPAMLADHLPDRMSKALRRIKKSKLKSSSVVEI
ncbi:hypothetical protein LOD99_2725 [Oopsacas minuta]|uniref:sn-1-specific diacylglycerol lipase n=1 Tax=Oopsacas minuta TaxID=111878 RepID=A0AAV7K117_9METZ|nr:hypothetical protein LOD99_2725 [Oopsacas minuta]